jgi:RNA polymerase sigma-70 factor, ECF subfamily
MVCATSARGKLLLDRSRYFDDMLWPHLRAAYNFARWLVRNEHDAEDVVQESFVKAFMGLERFRGGDSRVWLLAIVRNTAMSMLRRRKSEVAWPADEGAPEPVDHGEDPESAVIASARRRQVRAAIEQLPDEFRETLILRELEGLSYKEIAGVLNIPMGTVMSRLARARDLLMRELTAERGVR